MKKLFLLLVASLLICFSSGEVVALTYTVTNCAESVGTVGSFKWAVSQANSNAGADIIDFNIPTTEAGYTTEAGVSYWRIGFTETGVSISGANGDGTIISGESQTANQGDTNPAGPEIMIGGSPPDDAIEIQSSNCVIKNLIINNASGTDEAGILIYNIGADYNKVYGCYIGTDATGQSAKGNYVGVIIYAGNYNTIGSTESSNRNIISGNRGGVVIHGIGNPAFSTSNKILGNYIGTTSTGATALPNTQHGIVITNEAQNNYIGDGTEAGKNVISGNGVYGILITGSNTDSNKIYGNYVGTKANGTESLPNGSGGVHLTDGAQSNYVGKMDITLPNVISGNSGAGVEISGTGTDVNFVEWNYIGLDKNGDAALANNYGVYVRNGAQSNRIGKDSPTARNLISGNSTYGVYITGTGTNSNEVTGNYIGTDIGGTLSRPNGHGVRIDSSSKYNRIGGGAAGQGNLISGNGGEGVDINGTGTNSNEVLGNFIGTTSSGATALPNNLNGVIVDNSAQYNLIGGNAAGEGNVISGNMSNGIEIKSNSTYNRVLGNLIGTASNGAAALLNRYSGINILASDNWVGDGTSGGRNIISGNGMKGITIDSANNNRILGNFIGTDLSGTSSLGNSGEGVAILGSTGQSQYNLIGDGTAGGRNIISGNKSDGVGILTSEASGNYVYGNFIGTDVTGTASVENEFNGVGIHYGAHDNYIGSATLEGNVISGNRFSGVEIRTSHSNHVLGNLIGTTSDESAPLGNGGSGVIIWYGGQNNSIGDGTLAGRNRFSAQVGGDGINISGTGTDSNEVYGNYIGGSTEEGFGNVGDGVSITGGASYNKIGSSAQTIPNVIVGNGGNGVLISDANTNSNEVGANYIGVDEDGITPMGNAFDGVSIDSCDHNQIGFTYGTIQQLISANGYNGVRVRGTASDIAEHNRIFQNWIGLDKNRDENNLLGNAENGIRLDMYSSYTQVGDGSNGARNNICGNGGDGISIVNSSSNEVKGNLIGVIPDMGLVTYEDNPYANASAGVSVSEDSDYNVIGSLGTEVENHISANLGNGIEISEGSDHNQVLGNYVVGNREFGVNISESCEANVIGPSNWMVYSGYSGIFIFQDSADNLIGPENTIAGNGTGEAAQWFYDNSPGLFGFYMWPPGVLIWGEGAPPANITRGNTITENSIYENRGLGICLLNYGNDGIAAPVISSVSSIGANTLLQGTAVPNSNVEIFSTNGPDPSGSGEGKVYLGSASAEVGGSWSILLASVDPSTIFSATATDGDGNTSMFSVNAYADTTRLYLSVISPHENEVWDAGMVRTIECTANKDVTAFDIYYSIDGGAAYPYVITTEATLAKIGSIYSYPWTVPYLDEDDARIKITGRDAASNYATAESEGTFIISTVRPELSILSPSAGDRIKGNDTHPVTYEAVTKLGLSIDFRYSTDGGANWSSPSSISAPSGGGTLTYSWSVPAADSTDCYISMEAEDTIGRSVSALSDQFTIDSTPPTVVSIIPSDGATAVDPETKITVEFSELMNTDTVITAFSLTREGGAGEVQGGFEFSEISDRTIATFEPEEALFSDTTYYVTITDDALDLAGNHLVGSSAFRSSFRTAAETEPPRLLLKKKTRDNQEITLKDGDYVGESMIFVVEESGYAEIKFYLDGTRISASSMTLSAAGARRMEYSVEFDTPGVHVIRVEAGETVNVYNLEVADPRAAVRAQSVLAYPTTFNPEKGEVTALSYILNKDADVTLYIFSPVGTVEWTRKYTSGMVGGSAGYNAVTFDGKSDITSAVLANGIYPFKVVSGGKVVGSGHIVVYD